MLERSYDRKVAGHKSVKNTFGLPAGKNYSCPGATSICERICYAGKIEKRFPNSFKLLLRNWEQLQNKSHEEIESLLTRMIEDFKYDCERHGAPLEFRIHWDGDFFSDEYAFAWKHVILNNPEIQFWAYTRVISAALMLKGIDNLGLYYSTDTENTAAAKVASAAGIKLAGLGETFTEARAMLLQIGTRSAACPEIRGQIALQGACNACQLCIKGKSNITFAINKRLAKGEVLA